MKKRIFIVLLTFFSFNIYSQITFEKGYFINNANEKTECLIKNNDWRSNPTSFEYKITQTSEVQTGLMESVKEFGVYSVFKYIRSKTKIDRSSDNVSSLSTNTEFMLNEETFFLKAIVEGKATLYEYIDNNLIRYFYNVDNSTINQLLFKKYLNSNSTMVKNNKFRQQLWENLKCPEIELKEVLAIDYKKSDLTKFFTKYNKCGNGEVVVYEQPKSKTDLFHISVRPRFNSASLSIQNGSATQWQIDFDAKSGFGIGVEAEFVLPYYKNKWSIILEPTYQTYSSKGETTATGVVGGKILGKAEYKSIEIPIGLRHSFYLNQNSKLFIDGSIVFDMSSNSTIEMTRADGSILETLDIGKSNNLAFGIGYKYLNKYSVAAKLQTKRNILANYVAWDGSYGSFSLILGYTIF